MATTAQENKELIQRGFDALNDRDREEFVGLHADDAVLHFGGEDVQGLDAIVEEQWAYFDSFPDLALTPDIFLAENDMVAARWTVTGTHDGAFQGIEPTGTEVEVEEMGLFRVEDGEVAEVWLLADMLGLMQQLGVVEPPEE